MSTQSCKSKPSKSKRVTNLSANLRLRSQDLQLLSLFFLYCQRASRCNSNMALQMKNDVSESFNWSRTHDKVTAPASAPSQTPAGFQQCRSQIAIQGTSKDENMMIFWGCQTFRLRRKPRCLSRFRPMTTETGSFPSSKSARYVFFNVRSVCHNKPS